MRGPPIPRAEEGSGPRRAYRSHLVPRSREGRASAIAFVLIFLLAMPPVSHTLLNRWEPWLLGLPFNFATLLAVYVVLIGVLLHALRRGL